MDMASATMTRRGSIPSEKGKARLGYLHASPLVMRGDQSTTVMDLLDTAQDLQMIRKSLDQAERQIRFRSEVATPTKFRELLNDGCRMLHYTGHGSDKFLAFESDRADGVMENLEVETMKRLFSAGGVDTELVFISSCSSELSGQAFVEAGVPHVVAVKVKERITDAAAQKFGAQFYHALIRGKTVKNSFEIAHSLVNSTKSSAAQGDNFLLLPEGGNHEMTIFDTLPEGEFLDETVPLPPSYHLPDPNKYCLGTLHLQKLVGMLVDSQTACITVTGEPASGKTEMAMQACKYVRARRKFDAVYYTSFPKPQPASSSAAWGSLIPAMTERKSYGEEFCRKIGMSLDMPSPGPSTADQLERYLFSRPCSDGAPTPQKVLLVLDSVDSLYEGKGRDARDALVELLNQLCCFSGEIRLLLTSQSQLLRDTKKRFRNGPEKILPMLPLNGEDAAQLLVDLMPRKVKLAELGLTDRATHTTILDALQRCPFMQAAEGHPGTLVHIAPTLWDHKLNDAWLEQEAIACRQEFRMQARRRSSVSGGLGPSPSEPVAHTSLPGMSAQSVLSSATSVDSHFPPHSSVAPGLKHPLLEGAEISHVEGDAHWSTSQQTMPSHLPKPPAPELSDPETPTMNVTEQLAWDLASEAGVQDRGCRLVWVGATATATSKTRIGQSVAPSRSDRVEWRYLFPCLQQHLCGTLTIPSSKEQILNEGPYAGLENSRTGGGGYGSINSVAPRGMNDSEKVFVRNVLVSKQTAIRRMSGHPRPSNFSSGSMSTLDSSGRAEMLAAGRWNTWAGNWGGSPHDQDDVICIEAFVKFSEWWAPLMTTLSRLGNDWTNTNPVRVQGFVGRLQAERLLNHRESGTFLLRFSESRNGVLVVSFTKDVRTAPGRSPLQQSGPRHLSSCVQHCLVHVNRAGQCKIDVATGEGQVSYPGLHEFVRDCTMLKTLYPDTPKALVFNEGTIDRKPLSPPRTSLLSDVNWGPVALSHRDVVGQQ